MKLRPLAALLAVSCALGASPVVTPEQVRQSIADLSSPLPHLRRVAAENLGHAGTLAASAVPQLTAALDDPDPLVRAHAAWALGKTRNASAPVIEALARKIGQGEPEWPVRHNAALSLSWIGEPAVDALRRVLLQEGGATRAYAVDALLRIGREKYAAECAPVVVTLLGDRSDPVRAFSANLAAQLGAAGADAVPPLVKLLSDAHVPARINAIKALPKLGAPARKALPGIEKALASDPEQWVRIGAVLALGEIGEGSPNTRAALAAALSDPKERVSGYAAQVLAQLGEPAVPVLQEALDSPRKPTRMSAADSLAFMGRNAGQHAVSAAESLAKRLTTDPDWEVRSRAATALSALGTSDTKVIAALNAGLDDENEIVRLHARLALEKLGHPVQPDAAKAEPRSVGTRKDVAPDHAGAACAPASVGPGTV